MSANTSLIGESLTLPCGAILPNRIAKSAMTEGLAEKGDLPGKELETLYRRWSHGGAGLHITGNVQVDRRYLERAGNVVLEDDKDLDRFKSWAKASQEDGNHCWVQLNHPGRQCPKLVNSTPLSPSDVHLEMLGNFGKPKPMTEADIQDVIQRFARSAELCKEAGFKGIQIHSAHGYLLSQFLSPKVNKRQDQWGGSIENRARLLRAIIKAVREKVGAEYPIGVKLNSADFQKDGFSFEECVQVAKWLGEDGVDLLEISGGTYEQLSLMGVEPTEVRESTRKREAYFIEYAQRIREAANIPLIVTGGFRSRSVMEKALADKELDVIGLARPLCTQVNCPRDLIESKIDSLDDYEHQLVLGKGFWGNNSRSDLIKAINSFGAVGFYYWQMILLAKGKEPNPKTTTVRYFLRHMKNDFKLNMRRKFG
ncbi:MAG: NADH:flavin oxidoreductase/NADH oxidase family protein [Oleiphilaceae bacterium]|nr:NADH:flavin oxidoreductase/NADH oxidase family protein [Oleiphilaceae bacterium]